MFKIQFPFKVRMAMEVASSVAEHLSRQSLVEKGCALRQDRNHSAISIREMADGSVKFHYEGGIVVFVYLTDLSWDAPNGASVERWEVWKVVFRLPATEDGTKDELLFGPHELEELRDSRCGWYHPHVDSFSPQAIELIDQVAGIKRR